MPGRFTKYNGATEVIDRGASTPSPSELRRFKPDFYNPYRQPVRSPNLLTNRVQQTFGKRIVDAAERQVARRAPLALAGPLGDLLALGLIGWDLYLLLLELQNNANPVPPSSPPPAPGGTSHPGNYDWSGWNVATGQTNALPEVPDTFPVVSAGGVTYTPVGGPFVTDTFGFWLDEVDGMSMTGYQVGIGTTLEQWLSTHTNAGDAFQYHNDYDGTPFASPPITRQGTAWSGWYQRTVDGAAGDPLYIGFGTPLPMDLPLDWAEPDPNMKRNMFPDGIADPGSPEKDPEPDPRYKRGPRWRPPRPAPPKKGIRERKMKGPLNTILHVLDIVSEASEYVGAIYDALPKDVRDRWDQKGRGLMDNAGQYGIDGADWKLNAIWHNLHKVDVEQAIKNIIANEFQDKILGKYQQALPKNIGHVADVGSLGLNELITLFNDTIGLS